MAEGLAWLAGGLLYGIMAAVIGAACYRQNRDRYDSDVAAVFAGGFWPIGMFAMLGIYLASDRLTRAEKAEARQKVKDRMMEEHIQRLEIEAGLVCPHGREWGNCYRGPCIEEARNRERQRGGEVT